MENVYTLSARAQELNDKQAVLASELEDLESILQEAYEQNGGEVTKETEEMERLKLEIEDRRADLESLKDEVVKEIIAHADDYAELALNWKARKEVEQGALDAMKKTYDAALAKRKAVVNRFARREEWWKENFLAALSLTPEGKFGGAKTGAVHTVWAKKTSSIETDDSTLIEPYEDRIQHAIDALGLPAHIKVDITVSKAGFKDIADADLPKGAERVYKQTVNIR